MWKIAVWIGEWGKFDMRRVAEGGEESQRLFRQYLKKSERVVDNFTNSEDNPSKEMVIILDFDGLTFDQFTSFPSKKTTNVMPD